MSRGNHKKINMTYSTFYEIIKIFLFVLAFTIIFLVLSGICKGECLTARVGFFVGTLLLSLFIALFFENTRQKSFDILKISLSVLFVLFSTIHYFEAKNKELEMSRQKDLIEFSLEKELDKKQKISLVTYKEAWKKCQDMNDEYLTLMQEMIICFSIGIWTYMLLEMIPIIRISYLHQKMIKEQGTPKK